MKSTLNWIAVVGACLIGAMGLAYFGLQNPTHVAEDRWSLSVIAATALFALIPFLGTALAIASKRLFAALTFLAVVPIFTRWAILNASFEFLSHLYTEFACFCLVLGLYWLLAWWKEFPPLFSSPLPIRPKILVWVSCLLTAVVIDLGTTFVLVTRPYGSAADCGGCFGVYSRSTLHYEAVFTAHLIRVGRQVKTSDQWMGSWALARVQEKFWSWPLPKVVLLHEWASGFQSDEDYLVVGRRSTGIVTRFLPIVEMGTCICTRRVSDAGLELRVLRSGFPGNRVRIMGRVDRWVGERSQDPFEGQPYVLVQGSFIDITGPRGTITATTDREGIYDVSDLPPGKYRVQFRDKGAEEQPISMNPGSPLDFETDRADLELESGQVAECSFSFPRHINSTHIVRPR